MRPIETIGYVYLSDEEALQLVDYIKDHPNKHLVVRILTGTEFNDRSLCTHTFVGVNPSPYPGWNPNNPDPIEEIELIDPNRYMYL